MVYSIRTATKSDSSSIFCKAEDADMGVLTTIESSLVAVEDGVVLGFIRVVVIDGSAYVNPIVVSPNARRSGIGRALMKAARDAFGELRFVARGGATPFYYALGCERIAWEDIADTIAADCPTCIDLAACGPVPMLYR